MSFWLCYEILPKSDSLLQEPNRKVAKRIKRKSSDARVHSLPRKRPRFQLAGRVGSKAEGYRATVEVYKEPPVPVKREDLSDRVSITHKNVEKFHNSIIFNFTTQLIFFRDYKICIHFAFQQKQKNKYLEEAAKMRKKTLSPRKTADACKRILNVSGYISFKFYCVLCKILY